MRRRAFFSVTYTSSSQIRLKQGNLVLSNGTGNKPLVINNWKFEIPKSIRLHWTGTKYQLICAYRTPDAEPIANGDLAGIDLGEIHIAVAHTRDACVIANGRHLRSVRRYQNKTKAKLSGRIDRMTKGSKRRKKVIDSKQKQLKKINNQIRDILHKQTRHVISALRELKVQKLAIGDVRRIRMDRKDQGRRANQKLHQWAAGKTRWYLSYKARGLGMEVVLQDEAFTSQECPQCGSRNRIRSRNYACSACGFQGHRDGVGAFGIRRKRIVEQTEEELYVVGSMANPIGIRYHADSRRSTPVAEKCLALV